RVVRRSVPGARHGTFFFSSRRRHTRSKRDWSSDVCSSDLGWNRLGKKLHLASVWLVAIGTVLSAFWILSANSFMQNPVGYEFIRSEERRVGKECRGRRCPERDVREGRE